MKIRKGNTRDLPSIHNLICELASFENEPDAVATTADSISNDFANGHFKAFVAENESDGKIIGAAIYYTAYSTWNGPYLWLEDLIVSEHFRRKGIGKLLMDCLIVEAKSAEIPFIKWQVLDWNNPAIEFYKKLNATPENEWITWRLRTIN